MYCVLMPKDCIYILYTLVDLQEDPRLAIVKELLASEDNYLENLKSIFDTYAEPLK